MTLARTTGTAPSRGIAPGAAIGAGVVGGVLGTLLFLTPPGQTLERELARDWLFAVRGTRPAPPGVVVVSVDERDGESLLLARDDRRRGRDVYAAVLDGLSALGAAAVVLDVAFEDATDETSDRTLEGALARNGRAVLFQRLARTSAGDVPVPPLPRLASAARLRAVFPLPKSSGGVTYYWPFFRALEPTGAENEYALRELPSLPVAALQLKALHEVGADAFERLLLDLRGADGGEGDAPPSFDRPGSLNRPVRDLRRLATGGLLANERARAAVRERFDGDAARLLDALFEAFSEPGTLPLNFYGPPRTVTTLGHAEVLAAERERSGDLRERVAGNVVFVGHSGRSAVDQKDGFGTVYTRADGLDLSGVEIAATAYANLVDGSVPRPVSPRHALLIHVLLGLACALLATRAGVTLALISTTALGLGYFAVAVHAATAVHLLLPLGVPLLVLLPLVSLSALLYRHRIARRERESFARGARLLLPEPAVRDIESDRVERAVPERLHGSCLITDVADYARLSERLGEARLAILSREYFARLTERTRRHGGELIDLEGDSMTAVWATPERTPDNARLAVAAAVEMQRAVDAFNREHPDAPFATRIGLHAGWFSAGHIGGGGSYRYRVVGDIVNTASRLEGLNKRLGTRTLASRAALSDVPAPSTRPVGTFLLKGKREPLEVVELLGARASTEPTERALAERFGQALALLADGRREAASAAFAEILSAFGDDGPSRFYLETLSGRGSPDVGLDARGVVSVEGK